MAVRLTAIFKRNPMQEANASEGADRGTAIAAAFNQSSFQNIAQLLSPERVAVHLETLADLIDQAVLADGEPDEVRPAVHKLISVSASLGFDAVSMCSRRVEQAYCDGTSLCDARSQLRRAADAARPVIEKLTVRQ